MSLLLPNRDSEAALDLTLERLAVNTTHPAFELIVVDDGSRDTSVEILRRWRDSGRFASFTLLEREHAGVVESLNAGLEAASGEVVVQLDSDATVETPGWLERMLALLLADERVGVVTPEVVFDFGQIQACGVNLVGPAGVHDRPTRITEPEGRRRWHHRVERFDEGTRPEERSVAEVDSGIGCCMAYRREDALAAGRLRHRLLAAVVRRPGPVPVDPAAGQEGVLHPRRARGAPLRDQGAAGDRGHRRARPRARARLADGGRCRRPAAAGHPGRGRAPDRARPPAARAPCPPGSSLRLLAEKWGWHPLNPDMDAVVRRHRGSEICWALEPELTAAGREIADRFTAEAVRAHETCARSS